MQSSVFSGHAVYIKYMSTMSPIYKILQACLYQLQPVNKLISCFSSPLQLYVWDTLLLECYSVMYAETSAASMTKIIKNNDVRFTI